MWRRKGAALLLAAISALLCGCGMTVQGREAAEPAVTTGAGQIRTGREDAPSDTGNKVEVWTRQEDHDIAEPGAQMWDAGAPILVNRWNPLSEDYKVQLASLGNGHAVAVSCYPYLQQMMRDCRAAGLSPLICSSYRTRQRQQELFDNKVNALMAQGIGRQKAEKEASRSVAVPGTSEHELGLAVDIVDQSYQLLDEGQERTAVQKWLLENCWKYGFILRYPNDKSDITGIIYEPWHYRFVGVETALEIQRMGVCLEEYLQQKEN